jgi:hypothetical protein
MGQFSTLNSSEDVAEYILDDHTITLEDHLSVVSGIVPPSYFKVGKHLALRFLARASLQVNTICSDDLNGNPDYEHLYTVIRRIHPKEWFLPHDCIIFEPNDCSDSKRYRYHPNQFKPVDVIMRLDAKEYRWSLTPDQTTPSYEAAGNDHSGYIPLTNNVQHVGPDERYTVFQYYHQLDIRQEFMTKVFYKKNDDYLRLHAVLIPMKLLALILLPGSVDEEDRVSL